jgi:hypothetical protein
MIVTTGEVLDEENADVMSLQKGKRKKHFDSLCNCEIFSKFAKNLHEIQLQ